MDLMIESLPRLLNATKLTIELTLLSLFFGIFCWCFSLQYYEQVKIKFFIIYLIIILTFLEELHC